jgi:hypothetical protein
VEKQDYHLALEPSISAFTNEKKISKSQYRMSNYLKNEDFENFENNTQISVNRKTAHLQCLACVTITGSLQSTPTAALEVILMLSPLAIYIAGEAREAA